MWSNRLCWLYTCIVTFAVVAFHITCHKCTFRQYGKTEMEVNVHDAEGNTCTGKPVTSLPFRHKSINVFFQLATSRKCPPVSLLAATKLGQGNIFTSVCLSTGGGLPQCMLGCHPPGPGTPPPLPGSRHPPPRPGTPPDQAHPPWEQTPLDQTSPRPRSRPPRPDKRPSPGADPPPPPKADCSIRLTSGRYASYWNAFLFNLLFIKKDQSYHSFHQ